MIQKKQKKQNNPVLIPEWPAPGWIHACTTLRSIDLSRSPRPLLCPLLPELPREPLWLKQTHGTGVLRADLIQPDTHADASFSVTPGEVCAVLTADCLPVLLCDQNEKRIAAIHAGWRGLAASIIQATVKAADFKPGQTLAWLGPAIGPDHFEVGEEVREIFLKRWPDAHADFRPLKNAKWLADIYALARLQLLDAGISAVTGGEYCTIRDSQLFFSFRREKENAGRMATLIWMT